MLRTIPVFGGKRIGRKDVDAQTHACGNNLAQGDDTGLVSLGAGSSIRAEFQILFVSLPYLKKFSAKIHFFCGKTKPELVKVWALL